MKHIDILLNFFATQQNEWNQTYFAILPIELLEMIFDFKRQQELLEIRATLFSHFTDRRYTPRKGMYDNRVIYHPYYSFHKINVIVSVHTKTNQTAFEIKIKFFKRKEKNDYNYNEDEPHFTICTIVSFGKKGSSEIHYQLLH